MRARRREINIFNMSLLDILCGALGAFCFMMLVALPYYKPPGTAPELKKAQEETARLLHDLEQMKEQMRDPKSAEDMSALLERLKAQVQALQGQVNILTSEKEQLAQEKARLAQENQGLRAQNDKLADENSKLTAANKRFSALLARKKTFVVSAHCTTFIDLLLTDDPLSGKTREAASEEVNAFLNDDQTVSAAHLYLTKSGSATEIRDDANPEISHRIYVKLIRVPSPGDTFPIDGGLIIVGREQRMTRWPPFQLSAERPWALVGTVTIDQNYEPTFKAATDAERDAEWQAVTRSAPPPSPTATAAVRTTRQDVFEKFSGLMRIPPDDSGAHDAQVLQLTEELLKELPPKDILRRDVEVRRKMILENKARREGASPPPVPNATISPSVWKPAPAPSPTL